MCKFPESKDKLTIAISKFQNGIKFSVRVVPKSSKSQLFRMSDGRIKLKITAAPVDGKANDAIIKFLSVLLGLSRKDINIITGDKSREKVIQISGDADKLYDLLLESLVEE